MKTFKTFLKEGPGEWRVEIYKNLSFKKQRVFKSKEAAFDFVSRFHDDHWDESGWDIQVVMPDGKISTWNGSSKF